ncbi:hypothetical protein SAMN05216412_102273 [Nitrosospira multiformis]|uniref:Uncharacterized protein n=1 Tax=Nitrosospira multiformis TaxID=1231 RepID=A0A1I0AIY5_9PROT|nr:hypothetical protein SAMN05216412_102273 [Nitrosospira multiformis]
MLTASADIEAGVGPEIRWRNCQELPLYVESFTARKKDWKSGERYSTHGITVGSPEAASRIPERLLHPNELSTGTSISLLAPNSSYT